MNVLFSFIARHKKVCLSDVTIFLQPPMYYACPSNPALFFHPLTAKLLLWTHGPNSIHMYYILQKLPPNLRLPSQLDV